MDIERTTIEHGGIAYSVLARPAAPGSAPATPVIFVHGLGDSAELWRDIMDHPALAGLSCTAADLPGFGFTPPHAGGPAALEDDAAALANLIVAMGFTDVILVGHSLGGVVSTLIAEAKPPWLRGVVNVEGNVTLADCFISAKAAKTQDIDRWLYELGAEMRHTPLPWMQQYGVALAIVDRPTYQQAARDLVRLSSGDEIGDRYCTLEVPHLFICGTRDLSPDAVALLTARNQRLVVIEEAGHWVMHENRDRFAQALLSFVRDPVNG